MTARHILTPLDRVMRERDEARADATRIACWPVVALINLLCPAVDNAQAYDTEDDQ